MAARLWSAAGLCGSFEGFDFVAGLLDLLSELTSVVEAQMVVAEYFDPQTHHLFVWVVEVVDDLFCFASVREHLDRLRFVFLHP